MKIISDKQNLARIRRIEQTDHDRIFEIEKTCFLEPYSKRTLKFLLNNYYYISILIEQDSIIVGYAIGMLKLKSLGHVVSFAIHPEYRDLGYGSKLLKHLIEIFIKNRRQKIQLEVRVSNHAAIKLYQKFNFKIIDTKIKYYNNGEDAYLMELIL
ncbi:MAG: ribosomal protein S18-alanine N-acetyltransferase [Candidatus Helarchaeota archaeon]